MSKVKTTPTPAPVPMTVEQLTSNLITATETAWTVSKQPLFGPAQEETGSFGIFKDDGLWLGTVGSRYQPLQNAILAETVIMAATDLGYNRVRGGQLADGAKVYYQVELPDAEVGPDTLKRWVTALNRHDGSGSIAFGSTDTVVVCENTFAHAYGNLADKIKHTISAEERVREAVEAMTAAKLQGEKVLEAFRRMTEKQFTAKQQEIVTKILTGVGVKAKDITPGETRRLNDFKTALELETSRHGGATIWSLFNAATYYTNHLEVKNTKGELKVSPLAHVMVGSGFSKNKLTFNSLISFLDKNTAELVTVNK